MTAGRRLEPRALLGWIAAVVLVEFVVVTTAHGVTTRHLGGGLPPFFMFHKPVVSVWAIPAVAVLVASVVLVPRLLDLGARQFVATVYLLAVVARLAVNAIRFGPDEWARPLTREEGAQEYTAAVARYAAHPLAFVERFAGLVPHLPTHPAGHPPGPTLIAIALARMGLGGVWPITVLIVAVGALTAPLTYHVAIRLGRSEPVSRVAALVWTFAPASMLESVTSMDAVFCTAGVATVLALVAGRRWLGGVAVWLCSFLSYALPAVSVWAVIVVWRRAGLRTAARMAAAGVIAVGVGYAVLRVAFGYDAVAAFDATRQRYLHGPNTLADHRPIDYWQAGDVAAFLGGLGLPLVVAYGRALALRFAEAWALALIVLMGALSGYTKGEVERIWLFMVPLAALAIAPVLTRRHLTATIALLMVQACIVEYAFSTVW